MRALLVADWLRFRRRRDLWIIAIGVCLIGGVSFLNAYRTAATDPFVDDPVQLHAMFVAGMSSGGLSQAEIDAQLDQMVSDQIAQERAQLDQVNEEQKTSLQAYAFPQAMFTVIGQGLFPLLALILIGSFAVGDEFRFGTIRTSLLAAGNRRRFLAARLISLAGMTVGLLAALLVLGALLGAILAAVGADVPPTTVPIDALSCAAWFVGQVLLTVVIVCLGTAITLLLRSGALTVLLILIWALFESFLVNLPIFAPGQLLAAVPEALLTTNIRILLSDLGRATHAVGVAGLDPPGRAIVLPTIIVAAIVAAWGLLFLAVCDRRLRRMDVVE